MRSALIVIALLMMASPLLSDSIVYTDEATFVGILKIPYLLEDFDQYKYQDYREPSLLLDKNGYSAILSADSRNRVNPVDPFLYSLDGSMSTKWDVDILRVDFSISPSPVTAVGGYFWPTGLDGSELTNAWVRIVLSNGVEHQINNALHDSFMGFTVTDGTVFQFLEISTAEHTWPTLDNLYAGSSLPPVPEPSTQLLCIAGICGIGIISGVTALRKKKSRHF
jgi:hypothetical protein